jgi:sarcosine oxidase subunit beta
MTGPTADVIVVGAGVLGTSVALELTRRAYKVVVVDKSGGPGLGSTSASSAVVRFNYSTWDGVATAWESKHCWDNWPEHLQNSGKSESATIVTNGMAVLDVPISPHERVTPIFDRVGVPYERWDPATLSARIPGIDVGAYWPPRSVSSDAFFEEATSELGALYTPDAGFVSDPQLAAQDLAEAAQKMGARFLFNRTVVTVSDKAGRVNGVTLDDGTWLSAPVVINVAGPWSGALNRLAGVGREFTVDVRPMRQEVHQVDAPKGFNRPDGFGPSIADMDLGTYIRPAPGNKLYIGGTEPECDPFEWLDDPDDANPSATEERFQAQVIRAARRLPELAVPSRPKGVAGVYDVSTDWAPIYDRTDLDGFYVVMGTSGNQFKNAPLAGQFMGELVDAVEGGHDHDAKPVMHRCKYTGHEINIGAFSRKRSRNSTSSGTVMG